MPRIPAAADVDENSSPSSCTSIVGPIQILVAIESFPLQKAFSGEELGAVTSHWCTGSSTSVDKKNLAAPLIIGYALFRKSLSRV